MVQPTNQIREWNIQNTTASLKDYFKNSLQQKHINMWSNYTFFAIGVGSVFCFICGSAWWMMNECWMNDEWWMKDEWTHDAWMMLNESKPQQTRRITPHIDPHPQTKKKRSTTEHIKPKTKHQHANKNNKHEASTAKRHTHTHPTIKLRTIEKIKET